MMEGSIPMSLGAHLLFCTKNLERMGDPTTNIAEAILYISKNRNLSGSAALS
jgi:phosphate transport system protein